MLFLKFMLLLVGFGVLAVAAGIVLYDICLAFELDRLLRRRGEPAEAADQDAAAAPSSRGDARQVPNLFAGRRQRGSR